MFNLIQRLEALGPKASLPLLALAAALLLQDGWVVYQLSFADPGPEGWAGLFWLTDLIITLFLAMIFAMVGLRSRSGNQYPSPEESFPSMSRQDFLAAIETLPRPIVGCGDCLIVIEAHWDSGGCPRCSSSVAWYRVETDDDARLIVSVVTL